MPPAFPFRELILLCAFTVVAGTLVVQGLTLRPLILLLGLKDDGTVEKEMLAAQAQLARVAAEIIDADDSDAAQMLRAEFAMPSDAEIADGSSAREFFDVLLRFLVAGQVGRQFFIGIGISKQGNRQGTKKKSLASWR